MSADRTLMSVMRTSLSLIGFGFTIFQVFQKLYEADVLKSAHAAGNFARPWSCSHRDARAGIGYHVQYMLELRRMRNQMTKDGLIHGETVFPVC